MMLKKLKHYRKKKFVLKILLKNIINIKSLNEIKETKELLKDNELKAIAAEELEKLEGQKKN